MHVVVSRITGWTSGKIKILTLARPGQLSGHLILIYLLLLLVYLYICICSVFRELHQTNPDWSTPKPPATTTRRPPPPLQGTCQVQSMWGIDQTWNVVPSVLGKEKAEDKKVIVQAFGRVSFLFHLLSQRVPFRAVVDGGRAWSCPYIHSFIPDNRNSSPEFCGTVDTESRQWCS